MSNEKMICFICKSLNFRSGFFIHIPFGCRTGAGDGHFPDVTMPQAMYGRQSRRGKKESDSFEQAAA